MKTLHLCVHVFSATMSKKYFLTPAEVYQRATALESQQRQSPYLNRMARVDIIKDRILNSKLSARQKKRLYNKLTHRENRLKTGYVREGGAAIPVRMTSTATPPPRPAPRTIKMTPQGKFVPMTPQRPASSEYTKAIDEAIRQSKERTAKLKKKIAERSPILTRSRTLSKTLREATPPEQDDWEDDDDDDAWDDEWEPYSKL